MESHKESVEQIWKTLKETKLLPAQVPGTNWNAFTCKEVCKKGAKSSESRTVCAFPDLVADAHLVRGFEKVCLDEIPKFSGPVSESRSKEVKGAKLAGTIDAAAQRRGDATVLSTSLSPAEKELLEAKQREALFRIVYELSDDVAAVRYGALIDLRHLLFSKNVEEGHVMQSFTDSAGCSIVGDVLQEKENVPGLERNELAWALEELVITALLRRFGDETEKCRHLSVAILRDLLQVVPDSVVSLLPYILPVICERLPLKEFAKPDSQLSTPQVELHGVNLESCEELRLSLLQLVHQMLKRAPMLFRPFASEVSSILMAAAADSHPEVLKETFAAFDLFGENMGDMLKPVAKQLVSSIIPSLAHSQHQVRVAALRCIRRLVLCGAHESIYDLTAFRDPNLIPIRSFYHPDTKTQYLALLAADRNAAVREELLKTVSCWLLDLEQRKEHEVRLLPYILSGITDPNSRLQDKAFSLMEGIGLRYEQDFENEVRDINDYLPEANDDIVSIAGKPLPPPFCRRPCLGARILVRNCFSVMLHAISADLLAWTGGTKVLAADFFFTMLVFMEDNVTQHLQPVLSILGKTCRDPEIGNKIRECAEVVGFFVPPSAYLPSILPQVTGEFDGDSPLYQVAQALILLASLIQGTPESAVRPHISEICIVLTQQELITSVQHEVIEGVVAVTVRVVAVWSEECKEETISVMWILLNAAAASDFCGRAANEVQAILQDLAIASGYESSEAHISASVDEMLMLLPPTEQWAHRSLEVNIFCLLLQQTSATTPAVLAKLFSILESVVKNTEDMDVKLRLVFAVQSMLVCSPEEFPCTEALTIQLLESIVIPCLKYGGVFLRPTIGIVQALLSSPWFQVTTALATITTSMLEELQKDDPEEDEECEYGNFREPGTDYLIKSVLDQLGEKQREDKDLNDQKGDKIMMAEEQEEKEAAVLSN